MTRIELAAEVLGDLERIVKHLEDHDSPDAGSRIDDIVRAIDVLEHNPRIGRPVDGTLREVIIGRDASGYVALYTYAADIDKAIVLAIRSQREAGYPCPD